MELFGFRVFRVFRIYIEAILILKQYLQTKY